MDLHAHVPNRLVHLLPSQIDLAEEVLRHGLKSLLRPLRVPVYGRAVDKRWKLPAPCAERLTHRTHAQHNVEVIADAVDESGVHPITGG